MKNKYMLVGAFLVLLALALAGCQSAAPAPAAATTAPAAQATQPPAPACPTAPACPAAPAATAAPASVVQNVPFQDDWAKSPHADAKATAFNYWNETKDKVIPVQCAKCHSTPGYQDYLGADGSPAGAVDKPAALGTVIACVACHNSATATLTSVTFPSGAVIDNLGPEARCMVCHQGRESKVSVDKAIADNGLTTDVDKVGDKLGFLNIHYFAAASTLYGTEAKGGYQYDGKNYDSKFDHVASANTCVACHNPHTLEVRIDKCASCHQGVASKDDLKNIRMAGSAMDYNGNGDTKEGIAAEISGLQGMLLQAIQAYAKEKANTAIAYTADAYPYFFVDTNGNGQADKDEAVSKNSYKAWTARLLKAAYNYQTSIKDPGAFAHNGKYVIELLYDSIDDLNQAITAKVDLSKAHRTDTGHFNGSAEAFRHWDAEPSGLTPGACAKCHTAFGLPFYLANGVNINTSPTDGLNCATCHNDLTKFTRYEVGAVTFPSGAKLDIGNPDANLCLNCHQGRESKVSMDKAITASGLKDDEIATKEKALAFRNPHYFATGATLFGTQAKGMYEYPNQKYNGRNMHVEAFSTCVQCHDVHALTVQVDKCSACHANVKTEADLQTVRNPSGSDKADYDGNGKVDGIAVEVAGMRDALYAAIQKYATDKVKTGIVYSPSSYPYFFIDTNGDGKADPAELNSKNAYTTWTPRLLRAAYNYQWVQKDPGAFAHNGMYVMQVLYDAIKDVGGDVGKMTRPPVAAAAPAK